jgi:hypothetical protein
VGAIIYWGLVRFAVVLAVSWLLYSYVPNYGEWWSLFFVAVSVVVIYPAQIAWRKHIATVRSANQNALCATCKNLALSEALCKVTDEHVRIDYTPCEGAAWEPRG